MISCNFRRNTFDMEKFKRAAQMFVGKHDFRSFMKWSREEKTVNWIDSMTMMQKIASIWSSYGWKSYENRIQYIWANCSFFGWKISQKTSARREKPIKMAWRSFSPQKTNFNVLNSVIKPFSGVYPTCSSMNPNRLSKSNFLYRKWPTIHSVKCIRLPYRSQSHVWYRRI